VKLPCPLEILIQWEEMTVVELSCPLELEMMEVAVMMLPCPLETTKVAVAELLAQYEEKEVVELLVDQKEWQVHGLRVTTSVFDLTVYSTSVAILAHLRKFHVCSTILTN
jgi:hypothetical protein